MAAWRVRAIGLPDGDELDFGITAGGRWTGTPDVDAEPVPGRFVLPGLVDAHCHLSVAPGPDGQPTPLGVDDARANLARARAGGVTSIRDAGSPGSVTLGLLADADSVGLQVCGRFLAPASQYFPQLHDPVPADQLVDAALAEVAAGARWVKLVGDFPVLGGAEGAEPTPTYPTIEIQRLIDAVHAAGARVAVHTTSRYVTELIAAGVDSVEHGTDMEESDVAGLARRGGAWTPTLCAVLGGADDDPDRRKRVLERRERLSVLLPLAADLGVTIMTGTDVVGSVAKEVGLLTELGLSPRAALVAASTAARRYLGFPGLAAGELVDLVSYDDDPRDDPAVLARPAAVFVRGVRLAT